MLILSQSFPEISFLASNVPASLADYIGHKGRWQPHYLCHEPLLHTWWRLARCQASGGFALLLHSHPCPSARFTEVHKVMYVIHRVCHFCCRPKFQRVQTHGQAKLRLQRVLCRRFGNTYRPLRGASVVVPNATMYICNMP